MTEPVSNPYKLVPVKPTEAMIDAGRSEFMRSGAWAFHRFWSAMLAASPQGKGPSADADWHRAPMSSRPSIADDLKAAGL